RYWITIKEWRALLSDLCFVDDHQACNIPKAQAVGFVPGISTDTLTAKTTQIQQEGREVRFVFITVLFVKLLVWNVSRWWCLMQALVKPETPTFHTSPKRERFPIKSFKAQEDEVITDTLRNVAQGRFATKHKINGFDYKRLSS